MTDSVLNVQPTSDDPAPRVKRAPKPPVPLTYLYSPSDDGTDENLLIFLHGLGDIHVPFAKLGKQLHLPQTATLSVRAPETVPYLYEEAYQWYESFDTLGELLARPNPTHALDVLEKLVDHLVQECRWPANRIHLFGFGQGGSLAAELTLQLWKARGSDAARVHLGSIVSVAGPLLSYPTLSKPCPTPVLVFQRPASEATSLSAADLTAFRKGFASVQEVKGGKGEGMPRSKEEWEGVMRFWSEHLGRRRIDGLYEVMSGTT